MNILIAGSKGFIGSHLVDHLRKEHFVMGCDIHLNVNENDYRCIKAIGDYEQILQENNFDLFINASGSAGVGFSMTNPERDYELNTSNVEAMLLALKRYSPETRFMNFSSAAVYGNPKRLPLSEKDTVMPLSPYGKHKLESENILKKYHALYGLKTCSLRIFSAYGPGLHKQLFWDIFLKARTATRIDLFGTGKESRDFIFINDLVQAIDCVIAHAAFEGEQVNVASGEESFIEDAANLFLQSMGKNYELHFSGEQKKGDPVNWKADISVLKSFGFAPRFDLPTGLKLTVQDYLLH